MNQIITNTLYKIVGIGLMICTIGIGVIGFIKMWKQLRNQKD